MPLSEDLEGAVVAWDNSLVYVLLPQETTLAHLLPW